LLFTPDDMKTAGPFLNGRFFGTTGTLPPDYTTHPEVKRFTAELEQGQRDGLPWLDKPYTTNHMLGWVTAQAVIALLKQVKGDITPQNIAATMKAAKNLDLGGIVAPWTPTLDVDPGTAGFQVDADFYVTTVKNGQITLLDSKLRCGKLDGCGKTTTTTK
jgi:hypothetical protein